MGKLILPDTNVLILGLSGQEPVASWLTEKIKSKSLVFSAITVAEFLSKATDEEERIVSDLFKTFEVLPVDYPVAQLAAYYRKKYSQRGYKLKLPDAMIAATAKVYRLVLATLDKSGYPMKDLEIIDRLN